MKHSLTFIVMLLAIPAAAQFPPPYVHNYWDTNLSPNSPIMSPSKQVTNQVNSPNGVFGTLGSTANFTAQGNGNTIPLVVDELSGTNGLALFLSVSSGTRVLIDSNASVTISGIYYGNGSGLTNLSVLKGVTNWSPITLMDNAGANPLFFTNLSGALYFTTVSGGIADTFLTPWGSGAHLTSIPAGQLAGTIDGARLNTLVTNGYLRAVDVQAQTNSNTATLNDAQTFTGNKAFTGSNSFAATATSLSNGVVSAYGTNGGMIFNANPTNNSFEVKSNFVFGAQKQSWRPSSVSGFEVYTLSARQGDGTLANLESSAMVVRPSASGARSWLGIDTGSGGGGTWMDSQMLVAWTASTTDGSGSKDVALARNAAGVAEVNNGTAGTFADWKVNTIHLTNIVMRVTNAAPAGFTVAVTVPAVWFSVTNNAGTKFLIPGYAP